MLPAGIPLPLLVEVGLNVVDEGVDLLCLIGMDHKARTLVQKKKVLILVKNVQLGLEEGEEEVVLPGLVEKLVVDVQLQHVPHRQALIPLAALPVALDALDADVFLQEGGGKQGQGLGHKAVQPLSCVVFADGQFTHGEDPPSVDQGRGILPLPFYHESVFFQEKMEKSI